MLTSFLFSCLSLVWFGAQNPPLIGPRQTSVPAPSPALAPRFAVTRGWTAFSRAPQGQNRVTHCDAAEKKRGRLPRSRERSEPKKKVFQMRKFELPTAATH